MENSWGSEPLRPCFLLVWLPLVIRHGFKIHASSYILPSVAVGPSVLEWTNSELHKYFLEEQTRSCSLTVALINHTVNFGLKRNMKITPSVIYLLYVATSSDKKESCFYSRALSNIKLSEPTWNHAGAVSTMCEWINGLI